MPLLKTSGFLVSTVGKMHVTSSLLGNKITYLLCFFKSARKKCMLVYTLHNLKFRVDSLKTTCHQNQINCVVLWNGEPGVARTRPMVWRTQTKVTMEGELGSVVGLVNAHLACLFCNLTIHNHKHQRFQATNRISIWFKMFYNVIHWIQICCPWNHSLC